jgi:hypothetical protein
MDKSDKLSHLLKDSSDTFRARELDSLLDGHVHILSMCRTKEGRISA